MSLTFCERTLYHRCTEQTSPATFVLSTRAADSSICLLGVRLKPASFFAHPSFGTELGFLRTHGGSAFPLVLSRGSLSPAAPQYVQAAERAAARTASARTQQDSGPGWEPSRRPRAGAGRWSRVFRPRSVQLGWETARPGGGAPRESSAAAAPQCSREKQRGGRRSKVVLASGHMIAKTKLPAQKGLDSAGGSSPVALS
ncbi:hypothetical protein LEMLEM_LOCUS4338 [Lemmus lemmus]